MVPGSGSVFPSEATAVVDPDLRVQLVVELQCLHHILLLSVIYIGIFRDVAFEQFSFSRTSIPSNYNSNISGSSRNIPDYFLPQQASVSQM